MKPSNTISILFAIGLIACGDKSDDTADTAAAGPVQVSVDCSTATAVNRHWGGTTGPCGPEYQITVDTTGAVSTSSSEAELPDGSSECDVQTTNTTIEASAAATLIQNVCEEFNACVYYDHEQVDGSFDASGLFSGDDVLVSTAQVMCESGIPSLSELNAIWDSVTASK